MLRVTQDLSSSSIKTGNLYRFGSATPSQSNGFVVSLPGNAKYKLTLSKGNLIIAFLPKGESVSLELTPPAILQPQPLIQIAEKEGVRYASIPLSLIQTSELPKGRMPYDKVWTIEFKNREDKIFHSFAIWKFQGTLKYEIISE